jgi:histidinol phosphatase-like PHP family hydrolase
MTSKVYKAALDFGGITFSFASDAHALENVGDIGAPVAIARWLGIPGSRVVHLTDLQRRRR